LRPDSGFSSKGVSTGSSSGIASQPPAAARTRLPGPLGHRRHTQASADPVPPPAPALPAQVLGPRSTGTTCPWPPPPAGDRGGHRGRRPSSPISRAPAPKPRSIPSPTSSLVLKTRSSGSRTASTLSPRPQPSSPARRAVGRSGNGLACWRNSQDPDRQLPPLREPALVQNHPRLGPQLPLTNRCTPMVQTPPSQGKVLTSFCRLRGSAPTCPAGFSMCLRLLGRLRSIRFRWARARHSEWGRSDGNGRWNSSSLGSARQPSHVLTSPVQKSSWSGGDDGVQRTLR